MADNRNASPFHDNDHSEKGRCLWFFQDPSAVQTIMIKHLILSSSIKQVQADLVLIESDDIAKAIAKEVTKSTINKLVVGAASRGLFSRYIFIK